MVADNGSTTTQQWLEAVSDGAFCVGFFALAKAITLQARLAVLWVFKMKS